MPNAETDYRLVVFQSRLDPHIFRDILADELELHLADAMRLASHAPGVIPFPLSRSAGRRVGEKLASVGVEVGVWPATTLPDLSKPRKVHRLDLRAAGFKTLGLRGEPLHWVPWEHVEMVSVGEFPGGTKDLTLFGPTWLSASVGAVRSLVMGYHRSGVHVHKFIPTALPELWIVRKRPVQALRIQQERMNFDCLGDRRETNTRINFHLLVEELLRRAPHATRTPATQSFLVYDRPGQHRFTSGQQFMEYTVWQLVLRWRDNPPDSEPSTRSGVYF